MRFSGPLMAASLAVKAVACCSLQVRIDDEQHPSNEKLMIELVMAGMSASQPRALSSCASFLWTIGP